MPKVKKASKLARRAAHPRPDARAIVQLHSVAAQLTALGDANHGELFHDAARIVWDVQEALQAGDGDTLKKLARAWSKSRSSAAHIDPRHVEHDRLFLAHVEDELSLLRNGKGEGLTTATAGGGVSQATAREHLATRLGAAAMLAFVREGWLSGRTLDELATAIRARVRDRDLDEALSESSDHEKFGRIVLRALNAPEGRVRNFMKGESMRAARAK
jgi:hypothetical protein